MNTQLLHGDCIEKLKELPDCSMDAVVTDPPYGLSFMGKKWDYDVPSEEVWRECLRVLKPGGHLLAFAGTRTQHRMAVRIEDAGFEIRDMIAWVYGSGFPKSLDVSKAIDKAAGAEREVVGSRKLTGTARIKGQAAYGATSGRSEEAYQDGSEINDTLSITAPATPEAKQWQGWGTALKPSWECVTVARKPFSGTVAANVLEHGTGAINIDGCRVAGKVPQVTRSASSFLARHDGRLSEVNPLGRWPANLIHDGSEEVTDLLGESARFFYCSKASKRDRNEGLPEGATSNHPTVKPTALMRYLCRLVTPPGGTVLDPFMGSGSTGKAAMLEGFQFIGIEREVEYLEIAKARIAHAASQCDLLTGQT